MSGDSWATPRWLFEGITSALNVSPTLDVCASAENSKCAKFYAQEINGLAQDWDEVNWCNPPYSDPLPWVRKANEERKKGRTTIMLVKHDHSTKWWKAAASNYCDIYLITKRIRFEGAPQTAPWPCSVLHISPKTTGAMFHLGIKNEGVYAEIL